MTRARKGFAKHIILEIWNANNTNSASVIRKALTNACESGNLALDRVFIHRFSPHGVSGVAVIAESHITIHTWPEYAFAAVDIYSGKDDADIHKVAAVIKAAFSPCQISEMEIDRGTVSP